MLIMRLDYVIGMCELSGYDEKCWEAGGWFPIDSFSFSIKPVDDRSNANGTNSGGSNSGMTAPRNSGRSAASPGNSAANQTVKTAKKGEKTEKPEAVVSITKPVDSGTSNLMFLAMVHKTGVKGLKNTADAQKQMLQTLMADIHYVGSVNTGAGLKPDPNNPELGTFTHYLIHLEKVEITGWDIRASGDDRPVETLELKYEKAAACYHSLAYEGSTNPADIAAWDQSKSEPWDLEEIADDYFPDYPKRS